MPSARSKGEEPTIAAGDKSGKPRSAAKKKATKRASGQGAKRLRVRQVRSGIGHAGRFRRTLTALGLKHHQAEVVVLDNPSIRGMLAKVHHLVSVTPEEPNG